jgi:hypothetical protein
MKYTGREKHRVKLPKQNSKALYLRERMNKLDCIKLKGFCTAI